MSAFGQFSGHDHAILINEYLRMSIKKNNDK